LVVLWSIASILAYMNYHMDPARDHYLKLLSFKRSDDIARFVLDVQDYFMANSHQSLVEVQQELPLKLKTHMQDQLEVSSFYESHGRRGFFIYYTAVEDNLPSDFLILEISAPLEIKPEDKTELQVTLIGSAVLEDLKISRVLEGNENYFFLDVPQEWSQEPEEKLSPQGFRAEFLFRLTNSPRFKMWRF
jgi:hypothetical protein